MCIYTLRAEINLGALYQILGWRSCWFVQTLWSNLYANSAVLKRYCIYAPVSSMIIYFITMQLNKKSSLWGPPAWAVRAGTVEEVAGGGKLCPGFAPPAVPSYFPINWSVLDVCLISAPHAWLLASPSGKTLAPPMPLAGAPCYGTKVTQAMYTLQDLMSGAPRNFNFGRNLGSTSIRRAIVLLFS